MKNVKQFKRPKDNTWSAVLREANAKIGSIAGLCAKRDLCFQAGANVGVFPAYLSTHFKVVVTTEPYTSTYKYMIENLQEYKNIHTSSVGLADVNIKNRSMIAVKNNCGGNYIDFNVAGNIQITTIDDMLRRYDSCDLLYLDIEGAEYKALLGATETIKKYHPVIALENKGLIPEFPNEISFDGSDEFRKWVCNTFGYTYHSRMMRDDVFI
jgi:FkbM family methyltransferase